jgi:ATP-binding cassette subfamily G (WHITE) protein 2 (PDR)
MVIAGVEQAEAGGNIANLCFSLCLVFCGVLATPEQLPGFWIFMYRVSPFSYMVSGMLSVGVANSKVTCAPNELLHFEPPQDTSCGDYMEPYKALFGGYAQDPNATSGCEYCSMGDTNVFLATVHAEYSKVWRNFGILWAFVLFNIAGALFFYWLARVPKKAKKEEADLNPGQVEAEERALERVRTNRTARTEDGEGEKGVHTSESEQQRRIEAEVGEKA